MEKIDPAGRYRNGLIIGKFLPPHVGHRFLIEEAAKQSENLLILVCSLPDEPVPGIIRYRWMRELYPEHLIIHHPSELPSHPADHPDFWNLWIRSIRHNVPYPIDAVFSSETYGPELAKRLDARSVCIDLDRRIVPVSGSDIRAEPMRYFSSLEPPVKSWYTRRVVLIGAESTGKTTLAKALAERLDVPWTPEYGRVFVTVMGRLPSYLEMRHIAEEQKRREERSARASSGLVLHDTDVLTTLIYSQHYFGQVDFSLTEAVAGYRNRLYLFLQPDIPWVSDPGQRDGPETRRRLHTVFERELTSRNLPFVRVDGDFASRLEKATVAVNHFEKNGWS